MVAVVSSSWWLVAEISARKMKFVALVSGGKDSCYNSMEVWVPVYL